MSHGFTVGRAALPLLAGVLVVSGLRPGLAQRGGSVPQDTVVVARLAEKLSTRDARSGQRFEATLSPKDRSGLPEGTRFEGVLTEVRRPTSSEPGVLDMEFRRVLLPDQKAVAVRGVLASLGEEDTRRTSDGRYVSRKAGSKVSTKWIGYGAAGGAVLGTVLGGGVLKGALLGGLGGAVYGYLNREKAGGYKDVDLAQNTEFGIRLDQRLIFDDSPRYRYASDAAGAGRDARDTRDARDRGGIRAGDEPGRVGDRRGAGAEVRLDDRVVTFRDAQPMTINGELFVPLAPIARAANLRFDQRDGDDSFTLTTPRGALRCTAGDTQVTSRGGSPISLSTAPLSIDDEIYVSTEFLSRVTDFRVNWSRTTRRLTLETYQ